MDIGTGTWTTLTLIAADALGCDPERIALEIGDTALPYGTVAGGSSGTSSWGWAILTAAREFRAKFGDDPLPGAEVTAESDTEPDDDYRINSYGAHFVEARVDIHTGEITVPRMLGVFSIGRVVNPRTVRSQLLGGMTFGISMALFEESVRDGRFGHVVTQDLATYHFPTNADVRDIDAIWLDDVDERATTNLVDHLKLGIAAPQLVVDISRIPLDSVEPTDDGGLRIGTNVRNSDLAAHHVVRERYPALSRALVAGASPQLRNLATTGGNLLLTDSPHTARPGRPDLGPRLGVLASDRRPREPSPWVIRPIFVGHVHRQRKKAMKRRPRKPRRPVVRRVIITDTTTVEVSTC